MILCVGRVRQRRQYGLVTAVYRQFHVRQTGTVLPVATTDRRQTTLMTRASLPLLDSRLTASWPDVRDQTALLDATLDRIQLSFDHYIYSRLGVGLGLVLSV